MLPLIQIVPGPLPRRGRCRLCDQLLDKRAFIIPDSLVAPGMTQRVCMAIKRLANDFSFGLPGLARETFEQGVLLSFKIDLLTNHSRYLPLYITLNIIHLRQAAEGSRLASAQRGRLPRPGAAPKQPQPAGAAQARARAALWRSRVLSRLPASSVRGSSPFFQQLQRS